MHALRMLLVVTVILMLVGGIGAAVDAQQEEATGPPAEFSGRLECPDDDHYESGTMRPVFLGRFDEGSIIRRETRGRMVRTTVEQMSDPRLDGTWTAYGNTDEYIYIGTDFEPRPAVGRIAVRVENDQGAWQGSGDEVSLPGVPLPEWAMAVLTGEGAYTGLTAVVANHFVDEPCGLEVRGYIIEGEMPPMPEPLEPPAE